MKSTSQVTLDHEKLFQSLSSACIVVATDDPVFTILEENKAHEVAAMSKREDAIGKPLFEVFPDVSEKFKKTGVNDVQESIRRVIKTGEADTMPPIQYDLKNQKGEMTAKYWSLTHHPVLDGDKVIAVYQATGDITKQVLNAKKLKATQYKLGQALKNSSVGTWVWEIERNRTVGDEVLANIFGIDSQQLEEGVELKRLTDIIHPDDRERVRESIHAATKSPITYECEYRIVREDGAIRWLIARGKAEFNDAGKAVSFPGTVLDITERKTAENNLSFLTKASAQFSASLDYKQTLKSIADMVVPDIADWCTVSLLDSKGQLQQVAVAHKDPKKVKWAEQLNKKQGPPDLSDHSQGVAKVIHTGQPEHYQYISDEMLVASAKDEKELELLRSLGFTSAIIAPLKIDKKVIGAITFISAELLVHYTKRDVEIAQGLANRAAMAVDNAYLYESAQNELTARKRLQNELEAANKSLESRVKKRTQELEKINKGLKEEIARRHKAEKILQESSQELARSNQELQDFAYVASHDLQEPLRKIQAFGDILESEYAESLGDGEEYLSRMRSAAARMSVLIEDLLAFSRVSTKEVQPVKVNLNEVVRDVVGDLETSIEANKGRVIIDTLPVVMADGTHMRQLFQNLIGNALKFHRQGLPPEVHVRVQPLQAEAKYHEIHVIDNGIGFDEKYLDRIFSVFQRLHNRDTYSGTGIGLAVCRKIVERYGGTINATSKVGVGSTFVIQIPIEQKERNYDKKA